MMPRLARPVRPFQTLADPELHLENPFHGRILGRLLSTIQSAEPLVVLTGEPGTGKTTILRRLVTQLELRGFRSVIHRVPLGLDDLQATLSTVNHERRVVVGLDEAQALSDELLAALPALLASRPDVSIVLVGEPALTEQLKALEASGARFPVSVRCRLAPLDADEVGPYMEYCWHRASAGPSPFSASAVRRVASFSGGIPQIVNSICDLALHLAEARGQRTVSAELVDEVARGLILKAPWRPFPQIMRLLSARSPAGRAAIAAVAAVLLLIPLLIAGTDLLRSAHRGGQAPIEEPPGVQKERVSIEPPAVRTEPLHTAPSEPVVASRPAPKRERATRPVRVVARPVPSRAPSGKPSALIVRGGSATDEVLLQRAEDGDLPAVRRMLADGASPDARDSAGLTPLMLAVIHDHSAIVELLIAHGATVNTQSRVGLTPLMFAAINNRPMALRALMDRGANPNVRTKAGWTALTYGAWRGYPEIVRLLLARGADTKVIDRAGWTILEYASWRAVQPTSTEDLSRSVTGVETSRTMASSADHGAVIALLQQAGVKRDRAPASKRG